MAWSKVRASELLAGSKDVATLRDRCVMVGGDAVGALAGMVGSAGHMPVASALSGAASQAATTYVAAAGVYQHISQNLCDRAGTCEPTEQGVTRNDPGNVPAVSLAVLDGDTEALYGYATRLEMAGASAVGLGADTRMTLSSIHQRAAWTGPAATASLALGGDLGDGVAATSVPLVTIAAAVRGYAGALGHAQVTVSAYNRSAAAAEVAGGSDPQANAAMQAAARDAEAAVRAWQQADGRAASQIAGATAQLADVFTAGKPVRMYLTSIPAQINPDAVPAGSQITGAAAAQNLSSEMLGELPMPAAIDPVIGDGLPLATPMPLIIARHVDGPISREGPLTLDYRSWLDQNGHRFRPGMTSRT